MNLRRLALGAAGVGLVGAVLLSAGDVAAAVPVDAAVALLGNDYYFVAALGAVVFLAAAILLEHGSGVDQSTTPDPEGTVSVPTPGDGLSETLDSWRLVVPYLGREARDDVESRLREAAVEVVRRTETCTADEARTRVVTGEWTDDEDAAAFLSFDESGPSPVEVLRAIVTRETWYARRARSAADEIASRRRAGPATARNGGEPTATPSRDGSDGARGSAGSSSDGSGDRGAAG